ncbi:MAG TPA: peroxiredoxin family protein [Candidatus Kapabacteria bacterium]|nr:peroxiredoxin family protein [Candidatus Kapabacteria bacterium]
MIKSLASVLMLIATLVVTGPALAKKPPVGDQAPDFTLHADGPFNLRLEEQKGYVVVVGFWASWCRSCPIQLKALETLHQKYKDMGVKVWAITLDEDFEAARHHAHKHGLNFTLLQDGEVRVSERYDIDDLPATFVVDRDGKLRLMTEGFNPGDEARLDQFLETLVRE